MASQFLPLCLVLCLGTPGHFLMLQRYPWVNRLLINLQSSQILTSAPPRALDGSYPSSLMENTVVASYLLPWTPPPYSPASTCCQNIPATRQGHSLCSSLISHGLVTCLSEHISMAPSPRHTSLLLAEDSSIKLFLNSEDLRGLVPTCFKFCSKPLARERPPG